MEIRNFVIIAHIDHGKSTLADRLLELTGTIEKRKMREQFLDSMELEREKGITIKMQPVRMSCTLNTIPHILNLIDTPGHVDFTYEVSRALACVEGAILLVDAAQGVQAQTISNLHLARKENLVIIPVINKIDLPGARVHETEDELVNLTGYKKNEILKISAKTGEGIENILHAVVDRVPPPVSGHGAIHAGRRHIHDGPNNPVGAPRALIFDSHFDNFKGVIAHVRLFDGAFRKGEKIEMLATKTKVEILEIGYFQPSLTPSDSIGEGDIGYIATGLKEPDAVRIGDTVTAKDGVDGMRLTAEPLEGYREPQPMVFASMYPEDSDDYDKLRDALKKIKLNDASLYFEPEASDALGRGFRAGFLGLLHMEIIGERIRREYAVNLIFTTPSVRFFVVYGNGESEYIYSASRFPDTHRLKEIREPWARLEIITPQKFLGGIMTLLGQTRGVYEKQEYVGADRLLVTYQAPLKDILSDFFDSLKSVSEGYASLGYELLDYRTGDLVRLDFLIAGEREDAFSRVVPGDRAYEEGRAGAKKLKDILPKQLFAVSIQAAVSGKIIARETIPALKKDVTGYLYGGDRTRKMKL